MALGLGEVLVTLADRIFRAMPTQRNDHFLFDLVSNYCLFFLLLCRENKLAADLLARLQFSLRDYPWVLMGATAGNKLSEAVEVLP